MCTHVSTSLTGGDTQRSQGHYWQRLAARRGCRSSRRRKRRDGTIQAASKHSQVYTRNMDRCKCGYRLGEGYQNCQACLNHNAQHPAGRRGATVISRSIAQSDEEKDFDMRKEQQHRMQGVPHSAVRVLKQAAASKAANDLKRSAIREHVNSASSIPPADKARKFIAGSIKAPSYPAPPAGTSPFRRRPPQVRIRLQIIALLHSAHFPAGTSAAPLSTQESSGRKQRS